MARSASRRVERDDAVLNYQTPLRDIRFIMFELLEVGAWAQTVPSYAEVDSTLVDQVVDSIGRFAIDTLLPLNQTADVVGCIWDEGRVSTPPGFVDAYRAYRELGWPALSISAKEGGQGMPQLLSSIVQEVLSATCHAFVMYEGVNPCAVACLVGSASASLQARWLPALVDGSALSTMCLSEPQAGSDLGLLRTRAVLGVDGTYRVSGTKIFASGGEHDLTHNIVHLVLARLEGAHEGTRGLSLFLVPKWLEDGTRNAVVCDGVEHKMGLHGSATCTLRFDQATGWLVGDAHRGLQAMFPMMNGARLLAGAQSVGLGDIALQNSLAYARERRQGRRAQGEAACTLIEHPDVQRMLLTQQAWIDGGRALTYWAASLMDSAQSHVDGATREQDAALLALLTPVVKGFVSENAQQSISLALQIHGGHGYVTETGMEQLARDARIIPIYEGTTGIQAIDLLQRKVLGASRPLDILFTLIDDWLDAAQGQAALNEYAEALAALCRTVREVTAELEVADAEVQLSAANAYLRLIGHLVLALLWARSAGLAMKHDQSTDAFYAAKVATARFYYRQMLPETAWLMRAIRSHTDMAPAFLL